jgi:hypothetical protein
MPGTTCTGWRTTVDDATWTEEGRHVDETFDVRGPSTKKENITYGREPRQRDKHATNERVALRVEEKGS